MEWGKRGKSEEKKETWGRTETHFLQCSWGIAQDFEGLQIRPRTIYKTAALPLSSTSLTVTVWTDVTHIPEKLTTVYRTVKLSLYGEGTENVPGVFYRPEMILSSVLVSSLLEGHPFWSTCGSRKLILIYPFSARGLA
jgi:hypothetical protein